MSPHEPRTKMGAHADGFVWFNRTLALVLAAALTAPVFLSVEWLEQHAIVCALRRAGLPCPSCGLTRSLAALYGGDIHASRAFHPAGAWLVGAAFLELCARPLVAPLARRFGPSVLWLDLAQLSFGSGLAGWAVTRAVWP